MHLSARQFGEIVAHLVADVPHAPAGADSDKRRAKRVTLDYRATIIPYEDGKARDGVGVEVRDFSPRGIRFLHSARFARGTQFVLELPQQTGGPLTILCTVVHCRVTPEGPFSTGAEFTCALRNEKPVKPTAGGERLAERDRIRHSILD